MQVLTGRLHRPQDARPEEGGLSPAQPNGEVLRKPPLARSMGGVEERKKVVV